MNANPELVQHVEILERQKAKAKKRLWWTGVLIAVVVAGGFAFWHYQPLFRLAHTAEIRRYHRRPPSPTPLQPQAFPAASPAAEPDYPNVGVETSGSGADTKYLLSGGNIVALFAILVAGLVVRGGFAYGRIVSISFELANTKVHLEAGQVVTPAK